MKNNSLSIFEFFINIQQPINEHMCHKDYIKKFQ